MIPLPGDRGAAPRRQDGLPDAVRAAAPAALSRWLHRRGPDAPPDAA